MVYEVTTVYGSEGLTEKHTIIDVDKVLCENGVHVLLDEEGCVLASFPNDGMLALKRISMG